ncbi:MAG: COX15/CtaA family protein [Caldilineaceae bacterium]|nr:COX15/CtaA family protein [Caldilineaceae bacterium]
MAVNRRFSRYAWGVLALNVGVIIWGAYVRATGSGAGCGSHWPLCNGEIVPQPERIETLIEYSHRLTSGVALLAVIGLLVWSVRAYPKGHLVRKAALASMFFMIVEALVGAALVLLEYVAFNVSVGRAIWMGAHLINTFLLTAVLTLTAWWASGGQALRLRGQGAVGWTLAIALIGMLVLGVSGAITALGDTLVLAGGLDPQTNALVARLIELRIFHPVIAIAVGTLMVLAAWLSMARRPGNTVRRLGWAVIASFVVQLLLGALNVSLKAPVWLQMLHLFLTTVIWVMVILLAANALAGETFVRQRGKTAAPAAIGRHAT